MKFDLSPQATMIVGHEIMRQAEWYQEHVGCVVPFWKYILGFFRVLLELKFDADVKFKYASALLTMICNVLANIYYPFGVMSSEN